MRVGFFLGRFSALPARTRALNNAPATPHDAATARARTRTTTPHKKTKVACTPAQRGELRDLVCIFRASVIDVGRGTLTLEVTGREDKMRAMVDLLEPYGELGGVAGVGWGGRWGGWGWGRVGGRLGGRCAREGWRGVWRGVGKGWSAATPDRARPNATDAHQRPPPQLNNPHPQPANGVLEIARTGRVALPRESGVDTRYLETLQSSTASIW